MRANWINFFFGHPVRTLVIAGVVMAIFFPGVISAAVCRILNEFNPLIALGVVLLLFMAVFRRVR